MWGWLSGIVGGLETVWKAVTDLPQLIIDGIIGIFVPDEGYIETAFNSFLSELKMKFNLDWGFLENLLQSETPVSDVDADYYISGLGTFSLKFFDTSFFVQGVSFFRPFIRGFLVLLLFFFHVKQFIGFFGYDAGVVQGRSDWINYNRANTGGHKE